MSRRFAEDTKVPIRASGVSIFDDEFLANIVMPDGKLVATHIRPRLAAAYEHSGEAPALLPDFSQ
jgi:hypothetical protein